LAIQDPEAHEIPVEEVQKRTDIERHPPAETLEREGSQIWITEQRRLDRAPLCLLRIRLFFCEQRGVPVVLLNPKRDIVFLGVRFDEVVTKLDHTTLHVKMMIDQVRRIERDGGAAKHLQQVLRVVPAMPNPAAA